MVKAKPLIIGILFGSGLTLLFVFIFYKPLKPVSDLSGPSKINPVSEVDYSGIQVDFIREKIIDKGAGQIIATKKSFKGHMKVWIYDPKAPHNQGLALFDVQNKIFDSTLFPAGTFRQGMVKEYLVPPQENFYGKGHLYRVPESAILLVRLEIAK